MTNNQGVFFELVRAGLWEREARLSQYDNIDYSAILRLAEEQSVVGLITAGLGHVVAVKVPQEDLLQSIGSTLQIEQRNKAMNEYVAKLIDKLRKEDIYAILVKGQGIAQCYERPLWRASRMWIRLPSAPTWTVPPPLSRTAQSNWTERPTSFVNWLPRK